MEKSPNHNDQESSRSSSSTDQEVDQPADNMAAGRSYECVFCKRGFTTAQALGGHMNIHRKDRAKSNRPIAGQVPASIHPNNHHPQMNYHHNTGNINYGHPGAGYVPLPFDYYSHAAVAAHEPQHGNYRTHFRAFMSDGGPRIPQQLVDDGSTSLNLEYGGGSGRRDEEEEEEDKGMNRGGVEDEDEDEDEVDLELRLGYNP